MSSSPSNEELLSKVEEYLLGDESFAAEFESFARDNCSIFDNTEENKLEYMTIYQQFTELFNQRVEAFIKKAGSTPEKFVSVVESSPSDTFVTQMILSITSFDQFKLMMLDEKKKKANKGRETPESGESAPR
jgi:ADP-ribosylation factor 2-binding protein